MTRIGLVSALISILPLSACVGDEESARLDGTWSAERGDGCLVLFAVNGDECAFGLACALEGGGVGVERHEGLCVFEDGRVDMYWERSTCRDLIPTSEADYGFAGDRLVLEFPSARVAFERVEDDGMGSVIVHYGCWEEDTIVFGDLLPLE